MANIAVLVGSVRRDRKGIIVARWVEKKLQERNHKVYFIDPMDLDLPLLDRMYKEMDNPSKELVDLQNKIKDAEGYIPGTPEYNRSTSSALKNTLDYFLEEYYFKPSAIVSYSPGMFGGVNTAQHLRLIFAELGSPSIPSSFTIPRVYPVFEEEGHLIDEAYNKRVNKFLDEFEWYINALTNQRVLGTPY
ncbi:MAG: NADPH-dependent FMN reductase [Candidatus Nitrosocosmicus sp.]